jgi:hypothetical protein
LRDAIMRMSFMAGPDGRISPRSHRAQVFALTPQKRAAWTCVRFLLRRRLRRWMPFRINANYYTSRIAVVKPLQGGTWACRRRYATV